MLSNQGKSAAPERLSVEELNFVMSQCSERTFHGKRNRALIVALWRCGLKCKEALALLPTDVELNAMTIQVRTPKKCCTVGLDLFSMSILLDWEQMREKAYLGEDEPFFCTTKGKPLHPRAVRKMLHQLESQSGSRCRINPRMLRHTHAAELAEEGHPIEVIQQQLGHASPASTLRYLRKCAPEEVVETLKERCWSADLDFTDPNRTKEFTAAEIQLRRLLRQIPPDRLTQLVYAELKRNLPA